MVSIVVLATGLLLILIGLWGSLTHRNVLRIIISFSLMSTGIHIVIVALGYVKNGTAPIIDGALSLSRLCPSRRRPYHLGAGRNGHRHRTCRDSHHAGLRHPDL